MNTLSIKDCLRYGWETFKSRPQIFIAAGAIIFAIQLVMNLLEKTAEDSAAALPFALVALAIGLLIEMGTVNFILRAHDAVESTRVQDLWFPRPFWRFLGAGILTMLAVLAGLVLLIVPGIIVAIALSFTFYFIIDKDFGPIEALKASWSTTKGKWLKLLGLMLTLAGLNILGALALLVGLVVTVPVSMLAMVHAYRTLSGEETIVVEDESVPEPVTV